MKEKEKAKIDIFKVKIADTKEELEKQINDYFAECDAKDSPYLLTGLAMAIGVSSRQTLWEWANLKKDSNKYWRRLPLKKAMLRCEGWVERKLHDSKGGSPVGAIFALKNYGWKDEKSLEFATQGKKLGFIALPPLAEDKKEDTTTQKIDLSNSTSK